MKTNYKVINRQNRNEYILNAKEVVEFFKHQHIRDYAVSVIPNSTHIFLKTLATSILAVAFVVCMTKLIMQWL